MLRLLSMASGSSWERTSGGQTQQQNMEAQAGGFSGPGLGLVSDYSHHISLGHHLVIWPPSSARETEKPSLAMSPRGEGSRFGEKLATRAPGCLQAS